MSCCERRRSATSRPAKPRGAAGSGNLPRRCIARSSGHACRTRSCVTRSRALGVNGIEAADDHELHVVGVMLAGRRDAGAKLLQRALDRRHAIAIKQYAKARDEDALRQLWDTSMRSGDIPGAYWA